jgi:hypothetical protein
MACSVLALPIAGCYTPGTTTPTPNGKTQSGNTVKTSWCQGNQQRFSLHYLRVSPMTPTAPTPSEQDAARSAAPSVSMTNTASNYGAQGVFNAPVTINTNLPLRGASPPAFQVPYPQNPLFVGRDAHLAELEQILTTGSSAILTPVIAGMGGIGKT